MFGNASSLSTADLRPQATFEAEVARWIKGAQGSAAASRDPLDELLAEHHLMELALSAMAAETRRLANREPLRTNVWADLVDFMGNFVHVVHRRKEVVCLEALQAISGVGELPSLRQVSAEHARLAHITISIVECVDEGDWEGVLRAAHQYLALVRPHLRGEEEGLFALVRRHLRDADLESLQASFAEVERRGLGGRDRRYYLDIVQRLVTGAGLPAEVGSVLDAG